MVVVAIVAATLVAVVALTAFDAVARPGLRRLALRNIARRPAEAALVVVGSLLGTAIITSALIAGDTFENSLVDIGRRELGPVDVAVQIDGLDRRAPLEAALAGFASDQVDGRLTMTTTTASVATVGADRRAEPVATIAEVDFDAARTFGGDPSTTGFADAGPTPSEGRVALAEAAAARLRVGVGDAVEVFAYGRSAVLIVDQLLPELGVAGGSDAFVSPGAIAWFAAAALPGGGGTVDAAPPTFSILLSNVGGVLEGAHRSDEVVTAVESLLTGLPDARVDGVKADLLENARIEGDSIGQLFTMIGSFSVLVGILLLVNLFVMLAEERQRELGMLRAVGFKRSHLVRAFGIEGFLYAALAAVAGGFTGIGVGWLLGQVTEGILAAQDPGFRIVYRAAPSSVVGGMVTGFVISLVTVWATSARISRLNVIRAIRDLSEPSGDRPSLRTTVLAVSGLTLGVFVFQAGLGADNGMALLSGPAIVAFSTVPLLRRRLGPTWSVVGPAIAALVWGQAVFSVFSAELDKPGIEVFVVQGVVLVAAGVLLLSTATPVWRALTARLLANRRGLATHLALAYPLSRRVRTGIQLAMFSLIVFVITFMSVFLAIFGNQAEAFADADRGGFDLVVDSNAANPVPADQLAAVTGIEQVAPLHRGFARFSAPFRPQPTWWSATGFDAALVAGGVPELARRAPGYASDQAVFEAILAPATGVPKAIVPEFFLAESGGPSSYKPEIGGLVTLYSPFSDAALQFEVVGTTDHDYPFNGLLTATPVLQEFLGTTIHGSRAYVAVADGIDPTELASRLDGQFLANGMQAEPFLDRVDAELAEQRGMFNLMQGYLGLGLLIGVAGLGVVMVRAVRERRRQIGLLRAIGFGTATVRRAFLLEAGFIATQGIVLGIGLGLLTARQVLVSSNTFGEAALPFAVPWGSLLVILAVPLGASLLAAAAPAAQAATIRPAVALRLDA